MEIKDLLEKKRRKEGNMPKHAEGAELVHPLDDDHYMKVNKVKRGKISEEHEYSLSKHKPDGTHVKDFKSIPESWLDNYKPLE